MIDCDTQTRVLGRQVSHPFFIAPCAAARLAHNDGELALARVAQRAGIPYIVRDLLWRRCRAEEALTVVVYVVHRSARTLRTGSRTSRKRHQMRF